MSSTDPYHFLTALISKDEALNRPRRAQAQKIPLVVTLSRDYGAGGEEIAKRLAECLNIPIRDKQILELGASKAHVEPIHLRHHDESHASGISSFIFSVLTGAGADLGTYRRALHEAVLELSQEDAILIGRGAHLILSGKRVFRLRIVGSRLNCAKRIAEAQGIPLNAAERKVFEINNKRHKSIENLFKDDYEHCSLTFAKNFDLIINTDRIEPEKALPIILLAMQQAGYDLQHRVTAQASGP